MKKITSIFFLLLYLFATTEMYQFEKAPVLFAHYRAHKMADKNLTIYSFLSEHYINSSDKDPDYLADMQLPFKTHNDAIAYNISSFRFVQQLQLEVTFADITGVSEKKYQSYNQPHLISAYLAQIWQPPQIC